MSFSDPAPEDPGVVYTVPDLFRSTGAAWPMDAIARRRWEWIADETIDRAMRAGLAPLARDPDACRELKLCSILPEDD